MTALSFVAVFAALIGVSGFFVVPIGALGVPFVFQNMMVILSGLLLGPSYAVAAVGLWIIAGTIGLPVFSAGHGGFVYLIGPTGGFFIGYIISAFIAGFAVGDVSAVGTRRFTIRLVLISAIAFAAVYPFGVAWFMHSAEMDFVKALSACCLPFIPGDVMKCILAVWLTRRLAPRMHSRFYEEAQS